MKKIMKKWFTLIELLIVIVLISILSTIWFLSLSSYLSQARDTARAKDLDEIEKAFELYNIKNWEYPEPEEDFTIWEKTFLALWNFKKILKDPSWEKYTYKLVGNKIPLFWVKNWENFVPEWREWLLKWKENPDLKKFLNNLLAKAPDSRKSEITKEISQSENTENIISNSDEDLISPEKRLQLEIAPLENRRIHFKTSFIFLTGIVTEYERRYWIINENWIIEKPTKKDWIVSFNNEFVGIFDDEKYSKEIKQKVILDWLKKTFPQEDFEWLSNIEFRPG